MIINWSTRQSVFKWILLANTTTKYQRPKAANVKGCIFHCSSSKQRAMHCGRTRLSMRKSEISSLSQVIPPMKLLNEEEAKVLRSVLSIDIGLRSISFSHISRDFVLLDWGVRNLDKPKPYIADKFVQKVKRIVAELPVSDVALIETQSFYSRSENPSLFPFVLHNRITEAVLHSLLMSQEVRTFSIDANVVRKFFRIKRGKKRNYYSPSILQSVMEERARRKEGVDQDQVDNFVMDHKAKIDSEDMMHDSLKHGPDSFLLFDNISGSPSKAVLSSQQAKFYVDHVNKSDLGDSFVQGIAFLELEVRRMNYT